MGRSRGDIWFVDLTDARGHEQSGLRPAVVLAVSYGGMTIVVPLTTTPTAFSFPHTYGIEKSSQNGLSSQQCGAGLPDRCPLRGSFRQKDRAMLDRGYGSDKRSVEGPVIAGITGRQPCSGNAEQCSQPGRAERIE